MLLHDTRSVNVRLRTIVTLSHIVSGHAGDETRLKSGSSNTSAIILYSPYALA